MIRRQRSRSTGTQLDAVGLILVLALAVWVGVFAGGGDGRPGPVLWLLAGSVVSFAVGRSLSPHAAVALPVVAVAITGSVALTWPGILQSGGAPTGYANANATLTAIGVIAAIGAALHADRPLDRRTWIGLGCVLVVATVLTGSVAGVASLLVALVLLGLSLATRWPAFAVAGGLIAVSLALGTTTAIALGGDPAGLGDRAGVRGELWSAAADIARDDPVDGIGPSEFADANPVSRDADLRWAHHGFLQVAAELGFVGLGGVLAIIAWVGGRSWSLAERRPVSAALAASVMAVVGFHGVVDYTWHTPTVVLVASLLLGVTTDKASGRAGIGAAA